MEDMSMAMSEWYQVKLRGVMGPEPQDTKCMRSLDRTAKCEPRELTYEADDKHVKTIVEETGLDWDSKGSNLPLPPRLRGPR